jgi:hypothetical protein
MSQKFKLKYNELRENDPGSGAKEKSEATGQSEDDIFYAQPGNVRNLGFAWGDGRKQAFNYAYLVSQELNVSQDVNVITLYFTSHVVTIKGYKLDLLYEDLFVHKSRVIHAVDKRYATDNLEAQQSTVTEITVSSDKE